MAGFRGVRLVVWLTLFVCILVFFCSITYSIGVGSTEINVVPAVSVVEEKVAPAPCHCPGNIEITELEMGIAGWEGRLWVNTYGKALGLAVRRIDQPSYFKFWGGSYTEWGRCSPWSNHSMGGYCLVDEFWLTDKAKMVHRMYADPHIYDALP